MSHEIPSGIQFGTKVLLVPAISHAFRRSEKLTDIANVTGVERGVGFHWVNRGDPVGKFVVRVPKLFGESVYEALIPAPASGLLMGSDYRFADDEQEFSRYDEANFAPPVRVSILLPDDEPPPRASKQVFFKFTECVWERRSVYLKSYEHFEALDERTLESLLEKQCQLPSHVVDAMPHYEDYLQAARIEHSDLRPYLKHLLSRPGAA